jgi:hypothetical protein
MIGNAPFRYTVVADRYDHEPRGPTTKEWREFCVAIEQHARSCATSKDGMAIIPAVFAPGERLVDRAVVAVTALGLDVDADPVKGQRFMPLEEVQRVLPFAAVAYSTFSNSPDRPRYRVLFPLAEEIPPAAFGVLWQWANKVTGGVLMDPACKNPSRLYYAPRSPAEAHAAGWPWARVLEGPRLSMTFVPPDSLASVGGMPASRPAGRSQGVHRALPDRDAAAETLGRLLQHPALRWATEAAEEVTREVWRGIATNLICAADEHQDLVDRAWEAFNQISAADPLRYRASETRRTWRAALDSARCAGPMTFKHMVEHGLPEEMCSAGASCLVHAARRSVQACRVSYLAGGERR